MLGIAGKKIKALPIEKWMIKYAKVSQGVDSPVVNRIRKAEGQYIAKDHFAICHVELPDGHYYEAGLAYSYYVYNGIAYRGIEAVGWKHTFVLLDAMEGVSSVSKVKELAKLEKEFHGKASKRTLDMLDAIEHRALVRRCKKGMLPFRKQLKAVKEKRNEK